MNEKSLEFTTLPAPEPFCNVSALDRPMNPAVIEDIVWHRTHMVVFVSADCSLRPVLYSGERKLVRPLREGVVEGFNEPVPLGQMAFKINIANGENRNLLPSGVWQFDALPDLSQLGVSPKVMAKLEDLNRSFYFGLTEMYAVRFVVPQEDLLPPRLEIQVEYFKRNAKPKARPSAKRLAFDSINVLYRFFRTFAKKNGKRVLLMSENNEDMMGNLAAINQRIKERGLDSRFEMDYSFCNFFKPEERADIASRIRVIRKMALADFIFVEDYTPILNAISFPADVEVVQVWHAGYGFKLVGFGRFGIEGSPNPYTAGHRKYTHALVGNEHLKEIYSEVFGVPESCLLPTGMPRLEHFLDEELRAEAMDEFERRFPQAKGKHVVLFAPTYRGGDQASAHYNFNQLDFGKLAEFCNDSNSVILFKMHRFIKDRVPIPAQFANTLIDAGGGDINKLFYGTDVLVTDYSSCFYDFLLLRRPVVFFPYDLDYYAATRGIHRPVEEMAPGAVCMNMQELVSKLTELVERPETQQLPAMLIDRNIESDRLASDRVIDYLLLSDKSALD